MTRPSQKYLDAAFALLAEKALKGERCPTASTIAQRYVSTLAHEGRIFIEVFVHNYRVVTIMEGEAKGKKTAPPPIVVAHDGQRRAPKPYLTVGKEGTRRNGKLIDTNCYRDRTFQAPQAKPTMPFVDGKRVIIGGKS